MGEAELMIDPLRSIDNCKSSVARGPFNEAKAAIFTPVHKTH
jgi:hypothetical protein